jgi:nitroreductase/dihydropteridine reductase
MTFIQNLSWRYATKKFSGEKISDENLQKIKDAIRFAPSSFGTQPYHIVIVENKEILQKLKLHAKNNEMKFDTCSHMFVFCTRADVENRFRGVEIMQGRPKGFLSKAGFVFQHFAPLITRFSLGRILFKYYWSMSQTYIALGFGLAACAELQIDSCAMEGFDAKSFKRILQLPDHIDPVVLMAVGYRNSEDVFYPKTRFSEEDLFTIV